MTCHHLNVPSTSCWAATELKVDDRIRTGDRLDHNQELYQLSYIHRAASNLAADRGWHRRGRRKPPRYGSRMAQRRGIAFFRPEARPATIAGVQARGAVAVGALALGAAAVGGFAIGRLSVGRLAIGRAAVGKLKVGELEIGRLLVREDASVSDIDHA